MSTFQNKILLIAGNKIKYINIYKSLYFNISVVKIVDRTEEKKREDKLYRGMLEKAVKMFGDENVSGLDTLRITAYDKRDRAAMAVDVISSMIYLYDSKYFLRAKKLARNYESMAGREFTINLEYK